jgi:hypothetical protein
MARSSVNRSKKYENKLVGSVIENRAIAEMELKRSGFKEAVITQQRIEQIVKQIASGVNLVYYIIFAKQVVKLFSKHRGSRFEDEVDGLKELWIKRGLTETILNSLITRFSGYIPIFIEYGRYGTAKYGANTYA